MMRAFLIVLRKDLLRKIRSPLAGIVMLLFPVLFSLLIGMTFGSRGDKVAPIKIALVDEDRGIVARLLRSSFTQSQAVGQFDVKVVDMKEGVKLVEDDRVSALLRIPPGFSDSLLAAKPTSLELVKNPAQGIYPRIVEQYVKVLAQLGGAAVRVLGEPLQEIRKSVDAAGPPKDMFVSKVSIAISRRMSSVGRYALPPAIRLDGPKKKEGGTVADTRGDAAPFHVAVFVLPGMAVFALLTLAMISMSDFHREGAHGTLSRQFVAPIPFGGVVLGKMGATFVLALISILILALIAVLWAQAGVSFVGFAALSLAFALAATGLAALVHSLSRSERTGSAIGSILVMIMSMVGGSFVPLDSLPRFVRGLSPYTLNYWGTRGYQDLLFTSAGVADLLPNLAVLTGAGVILSFIAIRRFTLRHGAGG